MKNRRRQATARLAAECGPCLKRSVASLGRLSQHLRAREWNTLQAAMTPHQLTAGKVLLTAGQHNDTLYWVKSGELLISLPFSAGPLFLAARGAGSWVGEISLLTPGPATATVTAGQDTQVLSLNAAGLARLTEEEPALVGRFVRALAEDLAHRVRTAAVVLDAAPPRAASSVFERVFTRLFGATE